ncbi:sel1 repeat family protein [Escherichia coli]|nr:sel1 repeat family protein [Escherichia coli]
MKACLLLFFYFSLIGQLHGADVKIKENKSVMGSTAMTYDLSEEKLMKLKYKSQHGDSEASFRLYQYYCFTKNNIDKQLRFLERSASQGNVTAQFNYGVFLSDTNPTLSEYYNLNRAIYWMEFAVNNGNIDTKSKLQELKKLKRMDRRKNKENP